MQVLNRTLLNLYGYVQNNPVNFNDPSGLIEGSEANLARRQLIDAISRGYNGSHAFDYNTSYNSQYPKDSYKCSGFVGVVVQEAGAPISVIPAGSNNGRYATAGELANQNWDPNNWRQLEPGESPEPGDIFAYKLTPQPGEIYTGHTGIISNNGQSVEAHSDGVSIDPYSDLPGTLYRRYIGE